jgi:hypothetical protein
MENKMLIFPELTGIYLIADLDFSAVYLRKSRIRVAFEDNRGML